MADSEVHVDCGMECPMVLRVVLASKALEQEQDSKEEEDGDPEALVSEDANIGVVWNLFLFLNLKYWQLAILYLGLFVFDFVICSLWYRLGMWYVMGYGSLME